MGNEIDHEIDRQVLRRFRKAYEEEQLAKKPVSYNQVLKPNKVPYICEHGIDHYGEAFCAKCLNKVMG